MDEQGEHKLRPESAVPVGRSRDLPPSVRVQAVLRLFTQGDQGKTRIVDRHEAGAMRFRMPRRAGQACEAMIVNVAGGLAGGDRVDVHVDARVGSETLIASAAAERIYRSAGDTTRIAVTLSAEAAARLVWLPNETILHRGARLARTVALSFAPESRVLFGDVLQLGRTASGEVFSSGELKESWRFSCAGRLVFAEEMRLDETALGSRDQAASFAGQGSIATLILAGGSAEDHLETIRQALPEGSEVRAGASAHSGLVFARLISRDDLALRRAFVKVVRAAATGLPLPRLMLGDEP
jgi:urease accessory protein